MKTFRSLVAAAFALSSLGAQAATDAPAATPTPPPIVWQQSVNFSNFHDWGPSQRSSSGSVNGEVADDFDVVGTISRIDVSGFGAATGDADFLGIYVRFYAFGADSLPGAQQAEYFIPKGDPRILNPVSTSDFHVDLGTPFQASGKHFVVVQVSGNGEWDWRSADEDAPRGTALYLRNPPAGQVNWSHMAPILGTAKSDVAFTLYGARTLTAPTITSLSVTTLPQAGRIKINGSGFGDSQGSGIVKIGNAIAPVSNWTDSVITAYVPDAAPLAVDNVQVTTSGGSSNTKTLKVTARPPVTGHVKWRFQADGDYIIGRPAVGPDGTIYTADVNNHLYALTPTGGVKWIFHPGLGDVTQPVSVGLDGTLYYANIDDIYAVNPDGSVKWVFSSGGEYIFAGPTVGPDGNIYAVSTDFGFPNAFAAFVLSPAGILVSHLEGFSTRFGYSGIEIIFGPPNQWYFTNNSTGAVSSAGALYAMALGTANVNWAQPAEDQPRLQPSGNTVVGDGNPTHPGLQSFDSSGNLVWRSLGELPGTLVPGQDAITAVDTGADGNIYVGSLKFGTGNFMTSLNPNGTLRWQFAEGDNILSSPAVNSTNTAVVYSGYPFNTPSHFNALNPTTGTLLWRENLPVENGGNIFVLSVPRFSPDGTVAYVGTDANPAGDNYCYLYAFDVTGNQSTDTVKVTAAQYVAARKQLTVKATGSDSTAVLQVFATSTDTLIGTLKNMRGTYSGVFSVAANPVNITVKSSLGGTASAAVRVR